MGSSIRVTCHLPDNTLIDDACKSIVWTKVHLRTGELHLVYPTTDENLKADKATKSCHLTIVGQSQGYSGIYYCWPKTTNLRFYGNGSRVVFTGKKF